MAEPKPRLLVVDDDLSMREFLQILFQREGYEVDVAASGEQALLRAGRSWPDLVVSDVTMPGIGGLDLLRELKTRGVALGRDVDVVMVTAYGKTENAVEAMRHGAIDYVLKPFNNEELKLIVRRALAERALQRENARLREALGDRFHLGNLVGRSRAMLEVYDLVNRLKDTKINVLILGETGTGKEMVARAIHFNSVRSRKPFVPINCGAIPEGLVESELFGHKKGAFTHAMKDKAGYLQAADGGTLFLDEVNSLPLPAQVKLLRAIQDRRFTAVGDTQEVSVDVRVIAASNADLETEVREGRFREDLYYRLNVAQSPLPPLRKRRDDIPDLVTHFVTRFGAEYGRPGLRVDPAAMDLLKGWAYPGNVRELQNTVERAVALCAGQVIGPADLPVRLQGAPELSPREGEAASFPPEGVNLDALIEEFERKWIMGALAATHQNKTKAAGLLGLTFRSFRHRLDKYQIE